MNKSSKQIRWMDTADSSSHNVKNTLQKSVLRTFSLGYLFILFSMHVCIVFTVSLTTVYTSNNDLIIYQNNESLAIIIIKYF